MPTSKRERRFTCAGFDRKDDLIKAERSHVCYNVSGFLPHSPLIVCGSKAVWDQAVRLKWAGECVSRFEAIQTVIEIGRASAEASVMRNLLAEASRARTLRRSCAPLFTGSRSRQQNGAHVGEHAAQTISGRILAQTAGHLRRDAEREWHFLVPAFLVRDAQG